MVGRSGSCCSSHPIWNLAVANPTTLEHLGLDRTDRPARWPGTLLRHTGSPPSIGCGSGPFFVSANHLYVCAGMVGIRQCAGLSCCFGGLRGGGEWALFVVERNLNNPLSFKKLIFQILIFPSLIVNVPLRLEFLILISQGKRIPSGLAFTDIQEWVVLM